MNKKNINLYTGYVKSLKKSSKKAVPDTVKYFSVIALLIVFLSVGYALIYFQTESIREEYFSELDELTVFDADDDRQKNLEFKTEILEKISENYERQLDNISASSEKYSCLDAGIVNEILDCCFKGVTISEISFDGEAFNIKGKAEKAVQPSAFADKLQKKAIFREVIYNGYELEDEVYTFSVTGEF